MIAGSVVKEMIVSKDDHSSNCINSNDGRYTRDGNNDIMGSKRSLTLSFGLSTPTQTCRGIPRTTWAKRSEQLSAGEGLVLPKIVRPLRMMVARIMVLALV